MLILTCPECGTAYDMGNYTWEEALAEASGVPICQRCGEDLSQCLLADNECFGTTIGGMCARHQGETPPPPPRYLTDQELTEMVGQTDCELCGERLQLDDIAEWARQDHTPVIAHVQCGLDAGLELA